MTDKPSLLSAIKPLAPEIYDLDKAGAVLYSSIENPEFQYLAREIWFPRTKQTIFAASRDEMGELVTGLLMDENLDPRKLKFLSAQVVSVSAHTGVLRFSVSLDFTYEEDDGEIAMAPTSQMVYKAKEVFTAQCVLFVDTISDSELWSIANLVYAKMPNPREELSTITQKEALLSQYLLLGGFQGFSYLNKEEAPKLRKAYGSANGGTQLKLDGEKMVYVTDDSEEKIVMPVSIYLGASKEVRFPDYNLADALDKSNPFNPITSAHLEDSLLPDELARTLMEHLTMGSPMPFDDDNEVSEEDLKEVERRLSELDDEENNS